MTSFGRAARAAVASVVFLVSGAAHSAAPAPKVRAPQVDNPMRVLLVGNSYLYYGDSLHNHLRRMVMAADPSTTKKLKYKSATIGGARLEHHNIDWLTTPGKIGVKEPFELVILQGGSVAPLSEKRRAAFKKTVAEYAQLIRSRGGQVALYMTHAYVAPHKKAAPENLGLTESLYVETGNAVGALVIPVGLAFQEAYRRKPGIVLHKDYDGSHPSLYGTYLAAATCYAAIYGKSPVGNSYDYFGKIAPDMAKFLQQVAADTVKAFYAR
ncbi:MAG: hypothetical protein H6934_05560 [Burkholderiaceae bacterium]|nr:hypothetical protein [Burkholderiaceae bacterium]